MLTLRLPSRPLLCHPEMTSTEQANCAIPGVNNPYAPVKGTGCVEADGGNSCTAKELTITSASIASATLVGGGSLPAAAPCCKNPNAVCTVCLSGQSITGNLSITIQTNSAQVRKSTILLRKERAHMHSLLTPTSLLAVNQAPCHLVYFICRITASSAVSH